MVSSATTAVQTRPRWRPAPFTHWFIAAAYVLLAVRLARFVDRYAVNIVYWDQWDFLQGLFDGADAWSLFRWQHGHRQGLGNLIVAVLYPATGWNGRVDPAAAAVIMLLSAIAGPRLPCGERDQTSRMEAETYFNYKRRWRACYLATHDIAGCDVSSGHPVYPTPELTHLQQKLDWLEQHRYSLFRGGERPGGTD